MTCDTTALAKIAFSAWTNHPDPAFVDEAWERCSRYTKEQWIRVAVAVAIREREAPIVLDEIIYEAIGHTTESNT